LKACAAAWIGSYSTAATTSNPACSNPRANPPASQVGRILAGAEGRYNRISTFFTESFGLTLKMFGDTSHHDDRVARGSFDDGNAIVFYFADGRLVASLQAGQDDETENQLMELICHRATPRDMLALADGSVSLGEAFATDHALVES
jgi:hypothetical protein